MERILEILEDIHPGDDLADREDIIDSGCLDSLSVLALVAELEEEFDIMIPAVEIVPENFNSVSAMEQMVLRLQEDA